MVVTLYIGFAWAICQVTPFNKGPDEGINLDYITFIGQKGRLPITYDEREQVGPKANWPALYHLVVAWLGHTFGVNLAEPPRLKIFWDSFRYRALDLQTENPWHLLTEDQEWPYYGWVLILHLGRWFSILCSAVVLGLVFLAALEFSAIANFEPGLALVSVAFLAFIPTFIFVGSTLNEDALVALLAALYFWMLLKIIKRPYQLWPYWVIGLALGLSVTVKYTTVILPLEVMLVLTVLGRRHGYSWRWWLLRLLIVGSSAILASSWWFGWNFWYLNEVEELGLIAGLMRPLFTGGTDVTLARLGNFFSGGQIGLAALPEDTSIGTFPGWASKTFLSFWGVAVGNEFPLAPYAYLGVGLILGGAVLGLWRLWRMEPSSRLWLSLLLFHVAIFFVAPLVRFGLSRRLGQTAQGRHILIPAATAIVILIIWGLARAVPQRWQSWVFSLIIAGLLGWTAVHFYRLDTFEAPPLPLRTIPQAAEWLPNPVNARFGDSLDLVTYEAQAHPETGRLNVNLAWRPSGYVNESYLLKVGLVNETGQVVSYWLGYNGQGRIPTLAWEPGDVIFDRLLLPLPNLPSGNYRLQVQMLSRTGPAPVKSVANSQEPETVLALGDVYLAQPSLLALSQHIAIKTPDGLTEIGFEIWPAYQRSRSSEPLLYRYPGTISILTSQLADELRLELVDPEGKPWPVTHSEANVHTFVIGPNWPSGEYRVQIGLNTGNGIVGQAISPLGLKVENWGQREFAIPELENSLEANFANQLMLLGYKLPQRQVKAGEAFPITLYWQALSTMSPQADFIQFNQVLDSSGIQHGGYDRRPLEYYSTLLWAPAEVVVDGYAVPVDVDASPGEYYLNVGYYLTVGESAVTLPLVKNGEMTETSSVTIGPIEVIAAHE
jgi:hypothetical protein